MSIPEIDPATDLAQLQADLQLALEVEHATVPPYLAAWASAETAQDRNAVPRKILRTVFTEEMLHMTQVANLLLAVGGTPRLAYDGFVPHYPHSLPGAAPGWEVHIRPLSAMAITDFKRIEQPAGAGARPEERDWHTIAQLYAGVEERFARVLAEFPTILADNAARQIKPSAFYGSAQLLTITTAADVTAAITEIITQGEGADGGVFDDDPSIFAGTSNKEPGHFERFVELEVGKRFTDSDTLETGPNGAPFTVDYADVNPMRVDAQLADYADAPEVLAVLTDFNRLYGRLLGALELAYGDSGEAFVDATAAMFAVGQRAAEIARMPDPTMPGSTVGLVFDPIFDS